MLHTLHHHGYLAHWQLKEELTELVLHLAVVVVGILSRLQESRRLLDICTKHVARSVFAVKLGYEKQGVAARLVRELAHFCAKSKIERIIILNEKREGRSRKRAKRPTNNERAAEKLLPPSATYGTVRNFCSQHVRGEHERVRRGRC